MNNWKRAAGGSPAANGRILRKGLAWLLTAVLLVTMLPFLSSFAAYADSAPTSGDCGDSARWSYSTSSRTLTISGTGAMWDWDDPLDETAEYLAPWIYYYFDEIRTINIQSGVTAIGTYCFAECEAVTSVSIPNTVTVLGEGAFQDCVSLKSITIPEKVTTIGDYAFAFADALKEITIPASVTDMSTAAFLSAASLEKIHVASGNSKYKDIDGVVFLKSNNELRIYPAGKTDHVYTVPDGTKYIGSCSMWYNDNLRAVVIPEGVVAIGTGAFLLDEHLLRVGVPASLQLVDEYAFSGCSALADVYYAGTQSQRSSIGIYSTENDKFTGAEWHYQTDPKDVSIALFEDVVKGSWYEDSVNWAASRGVTSGTSDITFSPQNPCTRAQMVTFMWRAAGSPKPAGTVNPFKDVQPGAYYEQAVLWALENQITKGVTDTAFGPNDTVTRGQTVTFLYRWAGSPEIDEATAASNPFGDVAQGAFYYEPVLWAVKNSITNGMSADTFAPGSSCTRAQIVTFLKRVCDSGQV